MDTGGDAGLGGSRRKGRTTLRKKYEALSGPAVGGSGAGRAVGGGRNIPAVLPVVTSSMQEAGVFEDVFKAQELLYYLKAMARFIQKVADGGAEEAAQEFGVQTDSLFSTLQRKIRRAAPGNAASGEQGSDSHVRALNAFQAGSSKWAQKLTKARDIVVVTVNHVAMAVNRNVDEALLSSPRAILEEYVKLVIDSFLAGDLGFMTGGAEKEFRAKLRVFFEQHDKPAEWVEARIETTMKSFPKALL
jgi:hypothetical protein